MSSKLQELPVGYSSTISHEIDRNQIAVIFYPMTDSSDLHDCLVNYRQFDTAYRQRSVEAEYMNVHSQSGSIVGVGSLRYSGDEGELSSLSVLRQHRAQGIGTWLIAARLQRAEQLGLQRVYVERLALSNTIANCYAELGFVACNEVVDSPLYALHPDTPVSPHLVRNM